MRIVLLVALFLFTGRVHSQTTGDFAIDVGFDILKSDLTTVFGKAQLGAEFAYYLNTDLSVGAGFDYWTEEKFNFSSSVRWYPIDEAFLSARAYIGANQLSIGGGYSYFHNESIRITASLDLYTTGVFGIKAGTRYIIRRLHQ